ELRHRVIEAGPELHDRTVDDRLGKCFLLDLRNDLVSGSDDLGGSEFFVVDKIHVEEHWSVVIEHVAEAGVYSAIYIARVMPFLDKLLVEHAVVPLDKDLVEEPHSKVLGAITLRHLIAQREGRFLVE